MAHRTISTNLVSCIGYTGSFASHASAIENRNNRTHRRYNEENFFHRKNYKLILICLDDGYGISMDLIDYMESYCNLLKKHIDDFNSYSKKWKSKLRQQSVLSSYNTTKRAQLETIRTPERRAKILQKQHEAILEVIITYRTQVERMYPSERLSTSHKHYRTNVKKNLFKAAYSSLSCLSNKLEQLHEQQQRAENALDDANIQYENLFSDETISKNKITNAKDKQNKRKDKLAEIKREIKQTEKEYNDEQKIYRTRAREIYEECRVLEQERLDLIGETLIKFNEAAFSSEHLTEQQDIFEDLKSKLENQRNTLKDLDFWAQTYGIYDSSSEINHNDDIHDASMSSRTTIRKTKTSHKNETENITTIEENIEQSASEDQEEQSEADNTTTSTRT
ncbi:unnamed protein product [Rotaria sp. Silwood2]|nr:unnamed protein product [Rotaria sp. Silwood2]CAF3048604.1 unnamed protein product [Rotaria sp. Silwood2]CAF3377731.1 unnamed protein product [Rotaria sp. Silwood2]CAF4244886.1 unnamed protein product [Rotaria sp. Silwood2]CAF4368370.1 unnamed protein product [Rotaria sp. Silwood2]